MSEEQYLLDAIATLQRKYEKAAKPLRRPAGGRMKKDTTPVNACRRCAHLVRETESWEMPHIWWWECAAIPGRANLKSFPFAATKCQRFVLSRAKP